MKGGGGGGDKFADNLTENVLTSKGKRWSYILALYWQPIQKMNKINFADRNFEHPFLERRMCVDCVTMDLYILFHKLFNEGQYNNYFVNYYSN